MAFPGADTITSVLHTCTVADNKQHTTWHGVQVHMMALNYERAEAAVQSEAHTAVEQLQHELDQLNAAKQETEQRLSVAGQALESATTEIEQLTAALQDAELLQQLHRQQELVVEYNQAAVEVGSTGDEEESVYPGTQHTSAARGAILSLPGGVASRTVIHAYLQYIVNRH